MNKHLLTFKVCIYALWPTTCWATAITLGDTMRDVPHLAWLMVLVLSTVTGMAALLSRLKDADPARPVLFVLAHMLSSMVAGFLAFLAAEGQGLGDFEEAAAIMVAAYAGAKLMDRLSDRVAGKTGGES